MLPDPPLLRGKVPIPKPRKGERQAHQASEKRRSDLQATTARRAWRSRVGPVCAMCQHRPVTASVREAFFNDLQRIEGHHLIAKSDLRREGLSVTDRYDPRLKLDLCVFHHGRHEHFVERVPRCLYPPGVFVFAGEHGVGWLLEREIAAGDERATNQERCP